MWVHKEISSFLWTSTVSDGAESSTVSDGAESSIFGLTQHIDSAHCRRKYVFCVAWHNKNFTPISRPIGTEWKIEIRHKKRYVLFRFMFIFKFMYTVQWYNYSIQMYRRSSKIWQDARCIRSKCRLYLSRIFIEFFSSKYFSFSCILVHKLVHIFALSVPQGISPEKNYENRQLVVKLKYQKIWRKKHFW